MTTDSLTFIDSLRAQLRDYTVVDVSNAGLDWG